MFNNIVNNLYAASLWRTAAIVWQWCNVDNLCYLNTCSVDGTDGRLTSVAWTLNVCLHFAQTKVESYLCAVLGCHLCSVRSVLL